MIPASHLLPTIVDDSHLNKIDDEWRSYRLIALDLTIPQNIIPRYWDSLRDIKDCLNESKFASLSHFMTNLTVLPHSSACVERIFSQVNCIKTKLANSLKVETVRDRILAKQCLARTSSSCISWEPPKSLIKDLASGSVHLRYVDLMKKNKESNIVEYQHMWEMRRMKM